MRLPKAIKQQVQERLWRKAEAAGWEGMTVIERARQYAIWVEDPEIGTVLAHYIDPRKVHSYIKDTLMKPYSRASMSDVGSVLSVLGSSTNDIVEQFERPHGILLKGARVVCWGKADDWKLVVLAVHERAYVRKAQPYAAVLLPPMIRFFMPDERAVVHDASSKLGLEHLLWLDPLRRLNGMADSSVAA